MSKCSKLAAPRSVSVAAGARFGRPVVASLLGCIAWLAVVAGALPVAASSPDDRAVAREEPAISAEQAAVRATNRLVGTDRGVRLDHPLHQVDFLADGVRFEPRSGGLEWSWRLLGIERDSDPVGGVAIGAVAPELLDSTTVVYRRGAVVEQYLAHSATVEQRFVLERPLTRASADLVIRGAVASAGEFSTTGDGWRWGRGQGAVRLGNVRAWDATGRELPATMEATATTTRITVDGPALAAARYPVTIDPEIGANDFRISFVGWSQDPNYDANAPAVAYNFVRNEYLVVWSCDNHVFGMVDNELEIFGQRIDAETGGRIGFQFRVSDMAGTGNTLGSATSPAVAYDEDLDQYLVVWSGVDQTGPTVVGGSQIFGQLIDGLSGAEVGANDFQISDVGGIGNTAYGVCSPSIAYDGLDSQYLVVWCGSDNVDGFVVDEYEIFGQRIDALTGAEVGANDFRISDAGGTGNPEFDAWDPRVAYSRANGEYLVVWYADDNVGGLVNDEFEIFGQRIVAATGSPAGANDFRISAMGGTGETTHEAYATDVAYNPTADEYLVVWAGNGFVDERLDIFGQRINGSTGAAVGADDFLIGNLAESSVGSRVVYSAREDRYLVVWHGRDDRGGLSINETEIYVQLLSGASAALVGRELRISDMGGTGDSTYGAVAPALAPGLGRSEALVVWSGDDNVGPLVDNELEIFGQRIVVPLFADGFESGDTSAWQ